MFVLFIITSVKKGVRPYFICSLASRTHKSKFFQDQISIFTSPYRNSNIGLYI